MKTASQFGRPVVGGLLSGCVFGFLMKLIEHMTGIKVYVLLLNVDDIPILNRFPMPEWGGFSIHLFISVLVSCGFFVFFRKRNWERLKQVIFTSLISLIIGLLLYPTTLLSNQTPAFNDGKALVYWLLGHLVFGGLVGLFISQKMDPEISKS